MNQTARTGATPRSASSDPAAPPSASSDPAAPPYASPVDYDTYGLYGPGRGFSKGTSFHRPVYRFQGRITADGSSGYPAVPGRYHLYISWGCPWAQRTAIVRKLKGLEEVVSLSYVDDVRDGRGWAFREHRGADPVNGFTLLAQAYEATEPGYDGHVSVPALWDRETRQIVSNNFPDITIDLGTAFGAWAAPSPDLYPQPLRAEIDALNERVYTCVNNGPYRVAGATTERDYTELRQAMITMLEELDQRLAGRRYLFGSDLTEADVRLWPTLARFDTGYNPLAGVTERRLTEFGSLWAYARDLYRLPAFAGTTDFASFGGLTRGPKPTFLNDAPWRLKVEPRLADWDAPPGRDHLG
jgi:glutathione S-transferase/putative glutathione S-transferase